MDIDIIGKPNDWALFTFKKLFGLFFRKAEICRAWKIKKLLRFYHNTYVLLFCIDLYTKPYRDLWFNRTHLPLFQNMSVKIYIKFFLSSGGYNFKINYLKDKMRHGMWVHILLNNLASIAFQRECYFWHRRSKCFEKTVTFYLGIFEFKVLFDEIIKIIGLIFR